MLISMEFLLYILLVISLLFLVYVFVLVKPRKRDVSIDGLLTDYAHRGLHSGTIPENSLKAFQNAVDNGYGIELDVQLSKDGEVMVFHDYTLIRMTGVEKKLNELTKDELKTLSLKNTTETIPTFDEVLTLVDGKIPILIELKGEDFDTRLCEKVADRLRQYNGKYCIESFNPLLIKKMKKFLPNVFYGQLYTNVCREHGVNLINLLLTCMALNVISRPDFIAYNKLDRDSFPVILATKLYKAPRFVWTVKSPEEHEKAHSSNENAIFEK